MLLRSIALKDGTTGTVQTVFKGGTSLSRILGLIDRFPKMSIRSLTRRSFSIAHYVWPPAGLSMTICRQPAGIIYG